MGIGEHGAALLRRQFIQVTLQEGEVPLHRGEGGAQFVGSIGDKAPLGLGGALQRGEHLIERLHHLHHFIMSTGPWHALAQVAQACAACGGGGDGPCRCDECGQGAQHAGRDEPTRDEGSHQGRDPGEQQERA